MRVDDHQPLGQRPPRHVMGGLEHPSNVQQTHGRCTTDARQMHDRRSNRPWRAAPNRDDERRPIIAHPAAKTPRCTRRFRASPALQISCQNDAHPPARQVGPRGSALRFGQLMVAV